MLVLYDERTTRDSQRQRSNSESDVLRCRVDAVTTLTERSLSVELEPITTITADVVCALNLHCRSECRESDGRIDREDLCLRMMASSVAGRQIPHIARVALQECLPEGNGMQLDL